MRTEFQKSRKSRALFAFRQCWLPAVAAALILWSCLATRPPGDPNCHRLRIETIWASRQCGCEARQPRVRWVTDPDQLAAAVTAAKSSDLTTQVARHPVDWKHEGLVWIDMGLKPSGGYALSLAAPTAAVSAEVAVITVRWRQPRPGSVVTQQLTSPCLVLKLPLSKFHTIEIEDESGRMHASVEVNED
jgi:PrcB C-terminal